MCFLFCTSISIFFLIIPPPTRPQRTDTLFPYPTLFLTVGHLFEGVGGLVDGRLAPVLADQHQADRKPFAEAAGYRHRRMAGSVKWRRVGQNLEGPLEDRKSTRLNSSH